MALWCLQDVLRKERCQADAETVPLPVEDVIPLETDDVVPDDPVVELEVDPLEDDVAEELDDADPDVPDEVAESDDEELELDVSTLTSGCSSAQDFR